MATSRSVTDSDGQLAALKASHEALRQAATLPGADVRLILDSALAELDAAIGALTAADGQSAAEPSDETPTDLHAERRRLRAVFQDAPAPLFVLEQDGIVRRINRSAGVLLGSGTGYATGRPFTSFVDLRSRAAVHSQLAAVIRTGKPRTIRCELLTSRGPRACEATIALARIRSEANQLVVAIQTAPPADGGGAAAAAGCSGMDRAAAGQAPAGEAPAGQARGERAVVSERAVVAEPAVVAMTRRLDLVTAITGLLLENATSNEALTLQRCARLLADELASWVIVDVARDRHLRRRFVLGPEDEASAALAHAVSSSDPVAGTIPSTVYATGRPQLIAHSDNAEALGPGPRGLPLLMALGATSVLSVPLAESGHTYGALTLARRPNNPPFAMADLALVGELGRQLALAIRMDREVRRHTETAAALRESLLPRELPEVPGARVAISHLAATERPEVGGDFSDLFRAVAGWGFAVGDVCGRGRGVAAASAAARHAIRVVAHSVPDPATVLATVNQLLLAEDLGGRFVTACLGRAEWRGPRLEVALASAGHPPPVVLRADGGCEQGSGGGLPLGIFPDVGTGTETITLRRGDTLLCFTDGVTDARGRADGSFGDRLTGEAAALAGHPPREIVSGLQDRVLRFCQGEIRDDITMLAIQADTPPG